MSERQKIKIEQDFFDDPINVKLSGVRSWLVPALIALIAFQTCATEINTRHNVDLQRQHLEIAKKQYRLDSLRFNYMLMHQK